MKAIILHTIYSARRDKFLIGILIGMILTSLIAGFFGSTALSEGSEMKAVYAANGCRFIAMTGIMVFISFHIRRLFENKEMDVFLSRVPARSTVVFSFFIAFSSIALIISTQASIIIMLIYMKNIFNIAIWGLTLFLESLVVVAITLFMSIIIRSSTLGLLLCFATYLLSRVIGNFIAYIDISHANLSLHSITEVSLKILSIVIPRLDLFSKSEIVLYSAYSFHSLFIIFAQAVTYIVLMLCIAIYDMRTREF